jgi:hypothetical protein
VTNTPPARVPHRVNRRTLRLLVEHRRIQVGSAATAGEPDAVRGEGDRIPRLRRRVIGDPDHPP